MPASGNGVLWDLATRRPRATLMPHGTLILDASFSPDGKVIATAALNARDVRIWDVARLPDASASVIEASLNPNGIAGVAPPPPPTKRRLGTACPRANRAPGPRASRLVKVYLARR